MSRERAVSVGDRYGKLTTIERIVTHENGKYAYFWRCLCDCGKEKTVRQMDLRNGSTRSCGCLHSAITREISRKYNKYETQGDTVIVFDAKGDSFLISIEDLEKIKPYYWCTYKKNKESTNKYVYALIDGKKTMLHRFLMNPKSNELIDHINRNTLDYRRNNLRIASISENSHNSIHKNYRMDKRRNTFYVYIILGDITFYATAKTEREAHHIAYLKRRELHKEFAWDWNLTEEESWEVLHQCQ